MRPKIVIDYECKTVDCEGCDNIGEAGCGCNFCDKDKIASLVDALKELGVEVPQWMPIETAPKDGTPVLVVKAPYLPCVCEWADTYGWIEPDEEIEWGKESNYKPTHWMPLPTKPKE